MIQWERRRQHLVIELPELDLQCEILYENPEGSLSVALICHPHPLHQGTMYNKVVSACTKALLDTKIATFRFNFPGVGQSTGQFDDGKLESEVVRSLLKLIKAHRSQHQIILAGFSFGGAIASYSYDNINKRILIAPSLGSFSKQSPDWSSPTLLLHGLDDEIVPPQGSLDLLSADLKSHHKPKIVLYPDAGHFFENYLDDLKEQIRLFTQNAE